MSERSSQSSRAARGEHLDAARRGGQDGGRDAALEGHVAVAGKRLGRHRRCAFPTNHRRQQHVHGPALGGGRVAAGRRLRGRGTRWDGDTVGAAHSADVALVHAVTALGTANRVIVQRLRMRRRGARAACVGPAVRPASNERAGHGVLDDPAADAEALRRPDALGAVGLGAVGTRKRRWVRRLQRGEARREAEQRERGMQQRGRGGVRERR